MTYEGPLKIQVSLWPARAKSPVLELFFGFCTISSYGPILNCNAKERRVSSEFSKKVFSIENRRFRDYIRISRIHS